MSYKQEVEVVCPECSENQVAIVWTSLNVTLDPQAKEDLFNKRINLLECKQCGTEIQIYLQMLYHDMEKEFCAMYVPFSTIYNKNIASDFNKHGQFNDDEDPEPIELQPYDYMSHIHVVFDMEELIRYVSFRDKLFEDYEAMDKVNAKFRIVRDNAGRGEFDDGDESLYFYPEDL